MKLQRFGKKSRISNENGQAMLFTVLALGIFLVGAMAFAIDLSNWYFSRQSAQTAADAACTAAAMDMLVGATNGTMPSKAGFTPGTQFGCNSGDTNGAPTSAPCQYAALNSFASSITQTAASSGSIGDNVSVDFPDASAYICRDGTKCLSKLNFATKTGLGTVTSNPIVRVTVSDNIPTWFAGLLRGMRQQSTGATAICAVVQASSPIPILVLNPTLDGTLSLGGGGGQKQTGNIQIVGGPSKSIQVNSSSASATSFSGGPTVNLCGGGGSFCGSAMGVWGNQNPAPSNFQTDCTSNTLCTGTQQTPQWNSPSPPVADPYLGTSPPAQPTNAPGNPLAVGLGTAGCPDSGGCYEYQPGYYPSGICVGTGNCKNKTYNTAIFDPGIYYLDGNACKPQGGGSFCVEAQACVRPSTAAGDGSGGTVFYFYNTGSVNVGANAGGKGCSNVTAFGPMTQIGTGQLQYGAACDDKSLATLKKMPTAAMPTSLSGSVLLAPCRGADSNTYGTTLCDPNCTLNFGDPQGLNDPIGEQRGILFFQNRTADLASAKSSPSWGGGGSMLLAGSMYFHYCASGVSDAAYLACSSSNFTDVFTLGGNSGSSTYVLGDIIVDQLALQGNTAITMDLNPTTSFTTLKAALVQ